jgi:hypothetical protein
MGRLAALIAWATVLVGEHQQPAIDTLARETS